MRTYRNLKSVVALMMMTTPAYSDESALCFELNEYARFAMIKRQEPTPLADLLKFIEERGKDIQETDEIGLIMNDLLRTVVLRAYEEPLYLGEDAKDREIKEFSSGVLLECLARQQED